jgi:hypothetical protein
MSISSELLWTIVSFILTLMVFSYLFGDNPIFRFVSALFIGATAGYFVVILIFQVILPRLIAPIMGGSFITLVPLLLSGLLLMKLSPRLAKFGNIPIAFLVGTGAAVAIGGAVLGTLLGQIKGAVAPFTALGQNTNPSTLPLILESSFMLLGTIATLVYFNFGAKNKTKQGPKRGWVSAIFAWIGQFFIAITLGAVFAGVLTAAITALIERSDFVGLTIKSFFH